PNLWLDLQNRPYVQDSGDKLYRRSLYTYIKRSVPPPNMAAMDAPNREVCTMRRQRTSTPLMALVMMNDPTYVEAARSLAQRIMLEAGPSTEDRVRLAYEITLGRQPEATEVAELVDLYQRQLVVYQRDSDSAASLLAVGETLRDESLDTSEHAAWTCLTSVLLNLDETISKE
ncbi:MAG: DUF1553 domain-containing protein, partial [Planctomycetales bacterium]